MFPLRRLIAMSAPLVLLSCGGGSTGGSLITVPLQVRGVQGPLTLQTEQGWTVQLTTAQIWLGPFYFNAFPPVTDQFRTGVVIVEATEQVLVNALDPTLQAVPGGADGETGQSVAVEIDLFPPGGTPQGSTGCLLLEEQLGTLSGTATKGGTTIAFNGPIAIPNTASAQVPCLELEAIQGASVDLSFTKAPQVLQLTVDPTHWFDLVDFSQLLQGQPSAGVYGWSLRSEFMAQLIQGIKSESGVYTFQLLSQ